MLLALLAVPAALLFSGYRSDDPHMIAMRAVELRAEPRPARPQLTMTGYFPNPRPVVQAVGSSHQPSDRVETDRSALLKNATELGLEMPGLDVLSPGRRTHFGTYELVELIQQVGASFDERYPGESIRVGDLSLKRGGTIRDGSGQRVHSSHRNGLDADIMYLYSDCREPGNFADPACPVDIARSLELMNLFVMGGPPENASLVDLFYAGDSFRQRTCRYLEERPQEAEHYRDVLTRLQPMTGHEAHFHVRIRCPETAQRCPSPRKYRPEFCPRLLSKLDRASDSQG